MTAPHQCRDCGSALPAEALGGLCAVCLLRQGLDANHSESAYQGSFTGLTHGPITPGDLAALTESLGPVPRTLLRDTGADPLILPGSPEIPAAHDRPGRLQLLGEIARGGMGAVLKGRDNAIGRDLAVKVLLDSHRDQPDLIRRFIEEAQIGGQLQHPGIVPIYELGAFVDRRPYFAMKLVKGRTLASLLDDRLDPESELPRFLAIFEAVCQTVAYAHARGVIHRDLKPSNIMVGAFGEVQVMDWGLAKVLPQGGLVDDASAGKVKDRETVIATARSGSDPDSDLSRAGSVMGTPSYMAPEQARGEVDRLDERCDVFALGSILCELLTGTPAFTGRSSGEIQRKAARGELKPAFTRLESSTADSELIAIAQSCLADELEDRPRHAGVVAARITAHQAGVQERLRRAEIAGAQEKTRAEESAKRARVERQRLRLTVALAASILGLVFLGGGGWAYLARIKATRRAATDQGVTQAIGEANVLLGQAKAAPVGDLSRWPDAISSAKRADALLLAGDPSPSLRAQVAGLQAALDRELGEAKHRAEEVDRDRKFLEILQGIRLSQFARGDKWLPSRTDDDYALAFRDFGIDLQKLSAPEAGRQLKERSNPLELAFFLDDWALVRVAQMPGINEGDNVDFSWRKLVEVAHFTDPDPWRDAVRAQIGSSDPNVVKRLAEDVDALEAQPPRSLVLLAQVLTSRDSTSEAEKVLRRA